MKKRLNFSIGLLIISMFLFGAITFAATTDFTQNGFPKVVVEKYIKTGDSAKISHSGIKIQIPEGTFKHNVSFQVLSGDNETFQAKAPAGETVILNFAFRVIDLDTNEIIGKFEKAITFSFKDKDVNSESNYYNVLPQGTIAINNGGLVIEGRTLSHPIGGAPVGWMITSPTNSVKNND